MNYLNRNRMDEVTSLLQTKLPVSASKITAITQAVLNERDYKLAVYTLEKTMKNASADYKLPTIYCIDSVCRSCRKLAATNKHMEALLQRFQYRLLPIFQLIKPAELTEKDLDKIKKVLLLWQKNQVFDPEVLQKAEECLLGKSGAAAASQQQSSEQMAQKALDNVLKLTGNAVVDSSAAAGAVPAAGPNPLDFDYSDEDEGEGGGPDGEGGGESSWVLKIGRRSKVDAAADVIGQEIGMTGQQGGLVGGGVGAMAAEITASSLAAIATHTSSLPSAFHSAADTAVSSGEALASPVMELTEEQKQLLAMLSPLLDPNQTSDETPVPAVSDPRRTAREILGNKRPVDDVSDHDSQEEIAEKKSDKQQRMTSSSDRTEKK